MKPSKKTIKAWFNKCTMYKDQVQGELNEVMMLTQAHGNITGTEQTPGYPRNIETVVKKGVHDIQNFVMNTVFGRKTGWAEVKPNLLLLENQFGENSQQYLTAQKTLTDSSTKNTDLTFEYLKNTNYYVEVSSAVKDAANIGTGAYLVRKLAPQKMPFTFKHMDLNDFCFCTDSHGRTEIVFNTLWNYQADDIKDTFGAEAKIPTSLKDRDENDKLTGINIIQACIPIFDEKTGDTVYHMSVWDEGFGTEIVYDEMDYCPFTVFRFKERPDNPWGEGLGSMVLESIKDLKFYKKKRDRQVAKITDPAIGYTGTKALLYGISTEAGAVNYLGDGTNKFAGAAPMGLNGQLADIYQDILQTKQDIQDIYMSQPFADPNTATGSKSTEEISRLWQVFKQRHSGTSELFYQELLDPTFKKPYMILKDKGLLKVTQFDEQMEVIMYNNVITQAQAMEEVERVVQTDAIKKGLNPEYAQFGWKWGELFGFIDQKMKTPSYLVPDKKDMEASVEQQRAQAQAAAMAQLGGAKGAGVEGTEEVGEQITGG